MDFNLDEIFVGKTFIIFIETDAETTHIHKKFTVDRVIYWSDGSIRMFVADDGSVVFGPNVVYMEVVNSE